MCGITGWVDWGRDLTEERATLRRMNETMVPRGPDAGGEWLSPRAALAHRRLAIIDIEGGVQPMIAAEPDGARVLTYSGEIYNFRELRATLEAMGHRFRTRSDTEVLLRSYLAWGAECVTRFNGMFAFAIWDESTEELLLARDRLGIKPLYYAELPDGLVFGSEVKALLAHPAVEPEVDVEGLAEMFTLTQTPGHAVYRGIRSLPAGRIARVSARGCRESVYWRLESAPHEDSPRETVWRIRELLKDIVDRQLVADVKVGSLLSGGVDSSAVTALAGGLLSERGAGPISTYSVHFADSEQHFEPSLIRPELDTPFARLMAEHVGSRHNELVLDTQTVFDAQSEVLRARDLPGLTDINAAQYLLFKAVREDCTVVLSGESADEVFGGYPWFHVRELLDMPAYPWAARPEVMALLSDDLHHEVKPGEYVAARYAEAITEVPELPGEPEHEAKVRRMFHLNLTRWLTMLLDQKDRMSMRVGMEARVPFCDHRLVEYLWNVPWSIKTMGGQSKGLLREAVRDLLPVEIFRRAKTSFPVAIDPLYDKEIRSRMHDELADPNSPLLPLVSTERLRPLLDSSTPTSMGLWRSVEALAQLLQVAEWLRMYRIRLV